MSCDQPAWMMSCDQSARIMSCDQPAAVTKHPYMIRQYNMFILTGLLLTRGNSILIFCSIILKVWLGQCAVHALSVFQFIARTLLLFMPCEYLIIRVITRHNLAVNITNSSTPWYDS